MDLDGCLLESHDIVISRKHNRFVLSTKKQQQSPKVVKINGADKILRPITKECGNYIIINFKYKYNYRLKRKIFLVEFHKNYAVKFSVFIASFQFMSLAVLFFYSFILVCRSLLRFFFFAKSISAFNASGKKTLILRTKRRRHCLLFIVN